MASVESAVPVAAPAAPVVESPAAAPAVPAAPAPAQGGLIRASASLWVGDLAPEVNEQVLFDLFSTIAPVQSTRVCRSAVTRDSLGYAYVNFQSPVDAEKAMDALNYNPVKGKPCRIMFSQRDPTLRRNNVGNLFVKNLAPEVTSRDLHDAFRSFGILLSVKVATDTKTNASKGYGFVHFDSESAAKKAMEEVHNMEFTTSTSTSIIKVEPYLPRAAREAKDKWQNVYVKNVPKSWTPDKLVELFKVHGEITSAIIMKDEAGVSRGFAFVCFKEHEEAKLAVEALNNKVLEGEEPIVPPPRKEGDEPLPARLPRLFVGRAQKKGERARLLQTVKDAAKRERTAKFAGCNLYIRNLDESIDDERLRKEFDSFGTISSARIAKDAEGRPRGFGFVCFSSNEESLKARDAMNRKLLASKPLYVTLWEPKETRTARLAQAANARPAPGLRAGGGLGAGGAGGVGGPLQGFGGLGGAGGAGGVGGAVNPMAAIMMANPQMLMMMLASQNPQFLAGLRQTGPEFQGMLSNYMRTMLPAMLGAQQAQQAAAAQAAAAQAAAAQQLSVVAVQGGAQQQGGRNVPQQGGQQQGGQQQGRPVVVGGPPQQQQQQQQFPGFPMSAVGGYQQAAAMQQQQAQAAGAAAQQQAAAAAQQRRAGGPQGSSPQGAPRPGMPQQGQQGGMGGAGGQQGQPMRPMQAGAQGMQQQQQQGGQQQMGRPAMGGAMGAPRPMGQPQQGQPQMARPPQAAAAPPSAAAPAVAPAGGAPPAAAPAAAAASAPMSRDQFTATLAAATPSQRKNMIGEQLYTQIHRSQPNLAGKITGMLLEGMDDSELLHLLETPGELDNRIREAIDVLEQHKKEGTR